MRRLLLLIPLIALAGCAFGGLGPTPTPDPYEEFVTVRSDCGKCGTNSPVGGWEAANGRALILSDNGNFVAYFEDGTSMRGEWTQTGSRLCLIADLGAESCFSYQQKVDAMKLDDAIYIRE